MAIGARIRNEGGSLIQIDPSYENLGLKTVGSVNTTQYSGSGAGSLAGKATISVAGCNEPILCVFSGSAYVGVQSRSQSGTSYTWEIVTSSPTVTVNYWIFDTTDVAQMAFISTHGLRIRNAANNRVIFDSRYKYMRILSMINTDASTLDTNYSIPLSSGYAVGLSNTGLYTVIAGGPVNPPAWQHQNVAYVAGLRCNNDGTVSVKLITLASTITDGPSNEPPTGLMGSRNLTGLILDMRNY
jgi:hypothetical protein